MPLALLHVLYAVCKVAVGAFAAVVVRVENSAANIALPVFGKGYALAACPHADRFNRSICAAQRS